VETGIYKSLGNTELILTRGENVFFQTGPGTPLLKTTYSGKRPQTVRGIGRIMRENVDDGDR
jgi:hypothetical protein